MASLVQINDFNFQVVTVDIELSVSVQQKSLLRIDTSTDNAQHYRETPTHYRISTMTILSSICTRVDLFLLYKFVPVFPCGDILNVRYFGEPTRGIFRLRATKKKAASKNNQMFLNQITLDIQLNACRSVSIKLFKDGKIQLAGCRSDDEARCAIHKCISAIQTCGHICQNGIMEVRCNAKRAVRLKAQVESKSFSDDVWRDILYEMKKTKFKHSEMEENPVYTFPYVRKAVEKPDHIQPAVLETVMINSDFDTKVFIDKEKLVLVLKNVYGLHCRPASSRYPGINAKYLSNADCEKRCETDALKKQCADERKRRKGKNGCATVSILAFTQGKVIITGARSLAQLQETYDFIVRVFRNDYHKFSRPRLHT